MLVLTTRKGNCYWGLTMLANFSILLIVITTILIVIRILYVLYRTGKPIRNTSLKCLSTLIVLGSGGHTAEMLNLLTVLEIDRYNPRFYVAAATDNMSLQKARLFESSLVDKVFLVFRGQKLPYSCKFIEAVK